MILNETFQQYRSDSLSVFSDFEHKVLNLSNFKYKVVKYHRKYTSYNPFQNTDMFIHLLPSSIKLKCKVYEECCEQNILELELKQSAKIF